MSNQDLESQMLVTEELIKQVNKFIGDINEFQSKVFSSIESLEREGLPREMAKTYRAKHLERIKRYTQGIEQHLRSDTLRYAQSMKAEIASSIAVARG